MPRPGGLGSLDTSLGVSANTPDVRYTERQALPYKREIVGSAYVGGVLFDERVSAPYLYMSMLLNDGEIAGVDKIWIGANQLVFPSLSFNTILTPIGIDGQPNYPTRLQVSLRAGTDSQTVDPLLLNDFPTLDTNFRQQGIATAVFRYNYGADYTEFTGLWGQVQRPNSYLLVRGRKVYDPRDATQQLADPSTWKWSNNASLVQAFYLTQSWGGRIPTAQMRWDKVAEAADFDDEVVGCKDGSFIKRYTIDGVISLNQRPSDVLPSLLTANRGSVLQSGGKYWVSSSKPKRPAFTIHDGILAGGIEIRAAKPKKDVINKLQVRFVAQEQSYQIIDGPVLKRTDLEAIDQETLTGTTTLSFTLDHRRAQRLQKAFLDTSRLGKTITCSVDITLLADLDDDLIGSAGTVASELFPSSNGTVICTSVGFGDNCSTLDLTLAEYDPAIETDWIASRDEQDFTLATPFSL